MFTLDAKNRSRGDDRKYSAQGLEAAFRRRQRARGQSGARSQDQADFGRAARDGNIRGHASANLHALKGNMAGWWSVTVRANWRIIFRFENGNAFDVDLLDYH
jgi:plasmid maintenance system killer protein